MTWTFDHRKEQWTDGKIAATSEAINTYSKGEIQRYITEMGGEPLPDEAFSYKKPQYAHEHFQFCIDRAYQYLDAGDAQGAFQSFVSDMKRHPETQNRMNPFIAVLGMMEVPNGVDAVRRWINEFPSP